MFSWSFSKSAEAMFSRWAVKRVCKFLLKKKLGKFILGDIDLDHLDVQLGAGTIQLSDLALNVDYINEKFGTAAVLVKEGSVGSLTVTMPWKEGGCRVEVDELEFVIAPRQTKATQDEFETCSHSKSGNDNSSHGLRKQDNETHNNAVGSASVEVHEGVKTIAKMVKWLLTSFHVKIKKLIVAFDPLLEDGNGKLLDRILVLRISELQCGTHISEDSSTNFTKARNVLGISRLTNFLEFQGAVLELLPVDGLDHESSPQFLVDSTIGNWYSGHCTPGNTTTIISGEKGGFCGSLKLSLPWKNGSLDIRKVDANLHIEPLELRLEPSSIRSFIFMWNLLKGIGEEREDPGPRELSDNLSSSSSAMHPSGKGLLGNEVLVANLTEKENLLSDSHLISDWVSKRQKDPNEEEPDFGASVDQFFECIDGLRNSHSALGNSGMWNWTCSVFSAITAASNLASGSLHVPPEQQLVETNFSASVEKVSLLLSFIDEDEKQSPKMNADMVNTANHLHHLCAQFVDLDLVLQVHPREMNFGLTVQHFQLVDHFSSMNGLVDYKTHGQHENSDRETGLIQKMQEGVQSALWTVRESTKDIGVGHRLNDHVEVSLSMQDGIGCRHMKKDKDICRDYANVTLLRTSGVSSCHVSVNLASSGSSLMGPTSFTLKLPPFVCWMNFDLITTVLEFMREMSNCIGTTNLGNGFTPEPESEEYGFSHPRSTNVSTRKFLEGNIFLPNARIILCIPLKDREYYSSYSSCSQFIAFDLVSPTMRGRDDRSTRLTPVASFDKRPTMTTSCSLNLNMGDFYLFNISSAYMKKFDESETYERLEAGFSAEKIFSVVNGTGHLSVISMFWQEGPVTGPWIAKKAKLLASSEYGKRQDKVVGKDSDFASVTTVRDSNGFDTHTRQEMLASSAFFLHGKLPTATIHLDERKYENISGLLNQMAEHFAFVTTESVSNMEEHSALQTSFLFECESLNIFLAVEPVGNVKCSIHSELPSSWSGLTLKVDKFELLSVSNIGGINHANFLWVSHGKGSLWGSTEGLNREFLLISCSDSTMGRGDGEGSNVLSSRYSGSDIINFSDPESNHIFTSIAIRCATVVAIGGRLDWFNTIISFFILPSSESQQADDNCQEKTCGSSFILNLVDVGLSYEPYIEKLTEDQGTDLKSSDFKANEYEDEMYVACLLAASSLKLSNTTVADSAQRDYKIRLQDLGFLICMVPEYGLGGCTNSVEQLNNLGYVKVAQEANVEALFRTNCENGHTWELECAESHIMLSTCHDTTSGLIRLAAQLQKLFAPDMQDYVVHLENRWNNVQQAHEVTDKMTFGGEFSPLHQSEGSSQDKKSKMVNLMDEICEDVFQLDSNSAGQAKNLNSYLCSVLDDTSLVASGASSSGEKAPEFIEEYFLSDLRPLSVLSPGSQSSELYGFNNVVEDDLKGNDGWYGSTPLRILENHASKVEKPDVRKPVDSEISTNDPEHVNGVMAEGRIVLKNINVSWRMYAGSDWANFHSTSPTFASARDVTACLELALSGICIEYDVYPDGEISASTLSLTIRDFCLYDRSNDAPWKLVLGNYQSKKHPRKSSSKAVKLNLEAVRPDPSIHIEENRLRIAFLPLLLHLHQRQLEFFISFFGGKNSPAESSSSIPTDKSNSGDLFEKSDNVEGRGISEEAFLPYFQKFDIWPMLVRVDYIPSHVDLTALRGGKYVELVNLLPWKAVELQLKHVQGIGLYGWSSVCETILGEWLEDISQNQVHELLKGLPPIKSLLAVSSGAVKLVSLPVKSYKTDHRLLKGMQRGTVAFLKSISLEAVGLGVHLAGGAHNILLQAECILANIPPSVPWPLESEAGNSVKSNQPNDAHHGIQQAYQSISDGFGRSASALVQSPLKKYQRGASMGSTLATAVQSAPAAAIAPASAAARAVHCALLGFRNSLDPEHKKESQEKYLGKTPPQESKQ
ncbi:autophagy-related protein 2-like isoform X1 [Salvia splendens]|uniref:autophagy-related protein 2-like isoform X1 n=1 Tax=Salvia splendens TaxID=180675 RepID=UPI001C27EC86|nr:autophagy-related protein 2-like isoform X1 [Salvia splendens]